MSRLRARSSTPVAAPAPRFVPPMLASPSPKPPGGAGWAFEYKWDGVRAIIRWDGERLAMRSRLGNDITGRYPELDGLGDLLGDRPALLDGEIVALDRQGRPSFSLLQRRMHVSNRARSLALGKATPIVCMLFDVLWLDDGPVIDRPYHERRDLLAELELNEGCWRTPPHHTCDEASGAAVLRSATKLGLEGIVAKKIDSAYLPGIRSDAWRKTRIDKRQEFVIGGWTPGKGRREGEIGALLVGYHGADGLLHYAGKVGTGFDAAEGRRLRERFGKLARTRGAFLEKVPDKLAQFVEPELVCEVKFTEWTHEDILRHPSYQGLREDKDPRTVVRET